MPAVPAFHLDVRNPYSSNPGRFDCRAFAPHVDLCGDLF